MPIFIEYDEHPAVVEWTDFDRRWFTGVIGMNQTAVLKALRNLLRIIL